MYQANGSLGWIKGLLTAVEPIGGLLGGLFGGDPHADDRANFDSKIAGTLQQYARQYQMIVFCFWYGHVWGVDAQGNFYSLGDVNTPADSDALLQQTADACSQAVGGYGGNAHVRIFYPGSVAPTTKTQAGAALAATAGAAPSATGGGAGISWPILAAVGVGAFFLLRKKRR